MQIESYGLAYDREYFAVRARPTTAMPVRDLERVLDLLPGSGRPRGLAALVDGDLVGFVDHAPPAEIGVAVGLGPAVVADTEVGAELVARYLSPLGGGDAADALLDTVRAYFANDMRIDRTAEVLVMHPNSVRYRLTRFETLTGANLRDVAGALEIWWALKRAELDGMSGNGRAKPNDSVA
ncbi:PucR family transcriptional regulator [Smaragdicoccus niigatensis]|uniref:PucR family transcriptional regulator n=1 Tax=Smaragdicoccus niigatensis TaxID=359359 RepID=UPI00037F9256|nr:helix-turn-helix domain-containing protein [Smaragdicoccus niigatensis]